MTPTPTPTPPKRRYRPYRYYPRAYRPPTYDPKTGSVPQPQNAVAVHSFDDLCALPDDSVKHVVVYSDLLGVPVLEELLRVLRDDREAPAGVWVRIHPNARARPVPLLPPPQPRKKAAVQPSPTPPAPQTCSRLSRTCGTAPTAAADN